MNTLVILFTSFGLSLGFSWGALKVFPKIGLMDSPKRYGHTRDPIPYPGGLAIFMAFLVAVLTFLPMDRMLASVLIGASLLTFVSFVDDVRRLSPFLRLAIQFLAAGLLVIGGIGLSSISNPLGGQIVLDSINVPISLGGLSFTFTVLADLLVVFWVMTMVNAFNWIDGVSGMSSSVAAVSSAVLLLLSLRPEHVVDQTFAIALSSIILGISLGFLIFDFPKPKMLIGDTGSMLLGFLLAVTAIVSGGKIATTILVLGFPILDFVWVIARRLWQGQSPFSGDLWHFHHRLLKAGLSERQVVVFFALTAGIFGGLSLLLHTEGKAIAFAAIISVMCLLAVLLYWKK